jgi:pimeloyl-ACP methyl ester carboxylesterase
MLVKRTLLSLGFTMALAAPAIAKPNPKAACVAAHEEGQSLRTQKKLHARAEKRMCAMPPEIVAGMMDGFADYDLEAAFRKAGVPIRAINGDLFPTRIESNRAVTPDFDAVIMKGCGHYPMLERPEEFNRLLVEIVRQLGARAAGPADAK